MLTPFAPRRTDNSLLARMDRIITAAFSVAIVAAVGVMTFAQFMDTV